MRKIIFIVLLFSICILHSNDKPDWLTDRPIDNNFYIGIGISSKTNNDFIKKAKEDALSELSSEIIVNVTSEIINKIVEKSGVVKEELESYIKTSTQTELEGFELIGTWESNKEYWVYYRLSKELYESEKRKKIDKAVKLSLDFYLKAKISEKEKNIEKALLFYIQSLNPISKFIGEYLETEYEGRKIYLFNEIYSSLQNLFSNIEIQTTGNNYEAIIGKPLIKPLKVFALYDNNSKLKISNLPLKFTFIKGSGEMISKIRTNKEGIGENNITKITSSDKIQIVKCELDISDYFNEVNSSEICANILKSIPSKSTKFILNVSGLSIYFDSDEFIFENNNNNLIVEPLIKESFSREGFVFVDDISKADFLINMKATSRKGSHFQNLYFSYVDLTISIVNMSTGEEIYKNLFNNIKGADLNYEKACLKAFSNTAEKINSEIVKNILDLL
ncbi:MAG: LPP20 family lipoprotein [Bacteroidales bacterium]|nr:LPP20 family lipoprotein [Bacteroidales bacterium]